MTKTTLLLFALILWGWEGIAQTVTTTYYNRYFSDQTTEQKAYFIKTTKIVGEDKYEEIIRKKDHSVYASYKNGEPIGIWKVDGRLFDFNFEMNYTDTVCRNTNPEFKNWMSDEESIHYASPKTVGGESPMAEVSKNLVYPRSAERKGEEGRVVARFTVSATGSIEHLCILKSAGFEFDKEVCRMIREMKLTAATVNKVPVSICVTMPVSFSLPE